MLSCVVDNTRLAKEVESIKAFRTHDEAVLAVVKEITPIQCLGVVDVHILERNGYHFPVLAPQNAADIAVLRPAGFAVR